MATIGIMTTAGVIELAWNADVTKKDMDSNLRFVKEFLANLQACIEPMSINSEEDRHNWNESIRNFETQIPNSLLPEVKSVLRCGLTKIKGTMKPEKTWELIEGIYCTLNCTLNCTLKRFEASFS